MCAVFNNILQHFIHNKYSYLIEFFLVTLLAKNSIFDVRNTPMNTYAKHLLSNCWWAPKSIKNKGVYWYEKGYVSSTYPYLHFVHFSLFDFSRRKTFFFIQAISHFICIVIAKNKCWLCLFSKCAKQNVCFIGNPLSVVNNSHHQRRI